jgi:hypothetical protein
MNIASPCLGRMKHVIENQRRETIPIRLTPADLAMLYETVAPERFRVSLTRWMPASSLLWNLDNLRPDLCERFETDLVRRCLTICPQIGLGATEPEPENDAAVKIERKSVEPRPPAMEPVPETPGEKTTSAANTTWTFNPGTPAREDFFDKFIGWIAALVS